MLLRHVYGNGGILRVLGLVRCTRVGYERIDSRRDETEVTGYSIGMTWRWMHARGIGCVLTSRPPSLYSIISGFI